MTRRLLRLTGWAVSLVLLVAAGLHFLPLVRDGLQTSRRVDTTLALLEQTRAQLARDLPAQREALDARLAAAQSLGAVALRARQEDLRARLTIERSLRRPELQRRAAWLGGAGLAQDLEREALIAVLEAELEYLDGLALRMERLTARAALLQRLHAEQLAAYQRVYSASRGRCPASRVRWYDLTFSAEQVAYCTAYRDAREAYLLERSRPRVEMPAPPDTEALFAALLQPFDAQVTTVRSTLEQHAVARHLSGIRARVPTAMAWLLGVIATSLLTVVAVRATFYFVIAPAVSRRRPVLLLPASAAPAAGGRISAVSQPVEVDARHELLVHHRYLQSVATGVPMNTRWVLSWRYPFSSLAAGLVALTRIRPAGPACFVISATERDAISEIGRVVLADGVAMVLQPRALVGVLQPRDRPLRITRHWRLGTLGAWLTLQLRYLVFHGPAEVLVKGARGVRLEPAQAGRAISQAATLGFSANAGYSQVRTETFFPYLTGRQPLFNDRFAGAGAVYLYEETTGDAAGRGAFGRQLGGFLDALLRIFGI